MQPDLGCLHHLAGAIILHLPSSHVLVGMAVLLCRFDSAFFFVCVLVKMARENQLEEMGVAALSG